MKLGHFSLRLKHEGVKILDNKFETFEDLEDSMREMKKKFKGGK